MSKHTSGPWRVEQFGESGKYWFDIVNTDDDRIAEAEIRADADLIAAAPALLEAVELMLYRLEFCGSDRPWDEKSGADPAEFAARVIRRVRGTS